MHRRTFLAGLTAAGCAGPDLTMQRPLRISLLGQALIEHAATDREWPGRRGIAARLARADVVFTNLETVIQGPNSGAPTREALTLHAADAGVLDTLVSVHVNLMTTANNHAFDLGSGGILDTVTALRSAGLVSAGSGENLAVASAPARLTGRSGTTALVAFATGKIRPGGAATPGGIGINELRRDSDGEPNAGDLARILNAIAAARETSDVVLACQHNHDWESDPADVPGWQRALARRCVDAGASAFVGHGVPVLQGIEFHRGAPLFYGLGNFIFQTEKPVGAYGPDSWEGVIVDCTFVEGRFVAARLVPLTLNEVGLGGVDDMATRGFPRVAGPVEGRAILERLTVGSRALGVSLDLGTDTEGRLVPPGPVRPSLTAR